MLSRVVWPDVDPKWVYIGCLIPDVPWILQRAAAAIVPSVDVASLRLYVELQASLAGSLLLCACVSLFASSRPRIFLVLSANAAFHLLLDALQIKWGNGVHFLAPFSWDVSNWGLFWPESLPGVAMTLSGVVYIVATWSRATRRSRLIPPSGVYLVASILTAALYVGGPILLVDSSERSGAQLGSVLDFSESRVGSYVELDRARVVPCEDGLCLDGGRANALRIEGIPAGDLRTISVRGVFVSEEKIRVIEYHTHWSGYRDGASYVALTLIGWIFIQSLFLSGPDRGRRQSVSQR